MKVVLLPLKQPTGANQRLAGFLTGEQRQRLFWAMLEDVTVGLVGATVPDRIVVVTCSDRVRRHARARNWDVLVESDPISESTSVDEASRRLSGQGVTSVLRIPGDVPLLRSQDVDALLSRDQSSGSCVLVPSRDGTGTNAILRTPPDVFPSRFGPDSLRLHRLEAECRGIGVEIVEHPRLALDVDTPGDIDRFLEASGGPNTRELLRTFLALSSGPQV